MDPPTSSSAPRIAIRWMRPTVSTRHLQLPTAPISVSGGTNVDGWVPLSSEESALCEQAWLGLSETERVPEEMKPESDSGLVDTQEDPYDADEVGVGITISEDRLFEVDVRKMELRPIYWRLNSAPIKVWRATWMYDQSRPVSKYLADQLDEAYKTVQPWQASYKLELETAAALGPEAHEKLRYNFHPSRESEPGGSSSDTPQLSVIFEDAFTAKVMPRNNINQIYSKSLFGRIGKPPRSHGGTYIGTTVYYGYDAASAAHASSNEHHTPQLGRASANAAMTNTTGIAVSKPGVSNEIPSDATNGDQVTHVGDEGPKDMTDLVLVVHGIGQGLASQYQAWDFVYSVNLFRQIARKQSTLPALASILRNKQVQFLPVQWRASLKIGEEEEREREREGLDNTFSIADITLRNTIPAIRELTNNVLIDVPYFLSRHQSTMIESVCAQANRIYRRWCARNPGFERRGKVHIIGHSLGSVLSAYILSRQPTFQPPLSQMDSVLVRQCKDRFLFNTSVLFLVGSPLSIFVHLNHAQIIARKGRERTKVSPSDEALGREDVFGCLSVDSIYNIFNPSDPIAYMLNPCVDSEKAKTLPPSIVPTFNASFMSSISHRVTRLFNDVIPSFSSSPPKSAAQRSRSPKGRPRLNSVDMTFELEGHQEELQGSRAERRFSALNPHGTLDFQLPSEGSISEYVDMIYAHSSYWQDQNLAAFVLVELFASQQDLLRTGLVPTRPKA